MRPLGTVTTVEEQVLDRIREAILASELGPGARLKLRELAAELGVSVLPVRSALTQLRTEGLVRYAPRSGSIVAPLDDEDFEELQARRLGIESLAARLGAERAGPRTLRRMEAQLVLVDRLSATGDLDRFLRAESDFRLICYRSSGRDRLVAEVRGYRAQAVRYLRLAVSSPQTLAGSVEFQHRLLEACVRGDGSSAERETRRAIEWTRELVASHLRTGAPARGAQIA